MAKYFEKSSKFMKFRGTPLFSPNKKCVLNEFFLCVCDELWILPPTPFFFFEDFPNDTNKDKVDKIYDQKTVSYVS